MKDSLKRFNGQKIIKIFYRIISFTILGIFGYLLIDNYSLKHLQFVKSAVENNIYFVFLAGAIYFISFMLKAYAWVLYDSDIKFNTALISIFYSLLINHLSPIKIGDLARITVPKTMQNEIEITKTTNAVAALRLLDIVSLLLIVVVGIWYWGLNVIKVTNVIVMLIILISTLLIILRLFFKTQFEITSNSLFNLKGIIILSIVFISWILEGLTIYIFSKILLIDFNIIESTWIVGLTVIGQAFQVTPGGIGNYETIMSYASNMQGTTLAVGLNLAILSHAFKFIFSFVVGGVCIILKPISLKMLLSRKAVS